jgi:hypothetical protein
MDMRIETSAAGTKATGSHSERADFQAMTRRSSNRMYSSIALSAASFPTTLRVENSGRESIIVL